MAHSKLAVEKSVPLISGLIGDPENQMSASLYLAMSSNINDINHQVSLVICCGHIYDAFLSMGR